MNTILFSHFIVDIYLHKLYKLKMSKNCTVGEMSASLTHP